MQTNLDHLVVSLPNRFRITFYRPPPTFRAIAAFDLAGVIQSTTLPVVGNANTEESAELVGPEKEIDAPISSVLIHDSPLIHLPVDVRNPPLLATPGSIAHSLRPSVPARPLGRSMTLIPNRPTDIRFLFTEPAHAIRMHPERAPPRTTGSLNRHPDRFLFTQSRPPPPLFAHRIPPVSRPCSALEPELNPEI